MARMPFLSRRERNLWLLSAAYTLFIYATLAWMRTLTELLRGRNLLRGAVALLFVLVAGLVIAFVLRARPSAREWAVLALGAAGYAAVFPFFVRPEEQLHLIQYGLLGGLLFAAVGERRHRWLAVNGHLQSLPRWLRSPPLSAFLLATALGWIDELIQGILPTRYYDLRDVAFNALAAGLAIAVLAARQWVRRPEPAKPG